MSKTLSNEHGHQVGESTGKYFRRLHRELAELDDKINDLRETRSYLNQRMIDFPNLKKSINNELKVCNSLIDGFIYEQQGVSLQIRTVGQVILALVQRNEDVYMVTYEIAKALLRD